MNSFVDFITGPMVWCSVLICVLGLLIKTALIIKNVKAKESFVLEYISMKYALRSIFAWLIPFFPQSTRQSPVFYFVSYVFHLALFAAPLFLMAHILLIEEAFGFSWPALNDSLADILTVIVLLALIFFAVRRTQVPEVKYLTSGWDYVLLVIVALPFLTGFIAYHQLFFYRQMVIGHVITGEIMLILIPFTKLSHMIIAPLTRGYIGSEFGSVRHAKDW